ncbi:hypothetical protein [uncultured Parasphingorhabdus sp.]|uniref:hypothetical protein n=1 Tax=uncultured Parasphingorhabdus sp. TaxID=2709694 RepID=UPI002AA94E66|nr:hypothetical protein [uncultured Parasphingorhabdus sp.]
MAYALRLGLASSKSREAIDMIGAHIWIVSGHGNLPGKDNWFPDNAGFSDGTNFAFTGAEKQA